MMDKELEEEAKWIMSEYFKATGFVVPIELGTPMQTVHKMQGVIFRHYVEEMKKVIADGKH